MIRIIGARLKQKHRTIKFPPISDILPDRFIGKPVLSSNIDRQNFENLLRVCPTEAISGEPGDAKLDMGKCLFCGECRKVTSGSGIEFSREYRLSSAKRDDLIIRNNMTNSDEKKIYKKIKHIFGRSLKLRQVSAGGCNACEADINVLNTVGFDLGRFGIQVVASPRHADAVVVTGPVTKNMKLALEKTYNAMPSPKLVIAVGACAISGGPYISHQDACDGTDPVIPVDMYIPGCPPHPLTILDGFLRAMGRLK